MRKYRLLILFIFLFLSVSYFLGTSREGRKFVISDNFIVALFSPLVRGYHAVVDTIGGVFNHYVFLMNAGRKNDFLKAEVTRLKFQNSTLLHELGEKLLDNAVRENYAFLGRELTQATVLGFDPFAASKTIWIAIGKKEDIEINAVVIAEKGLVGRVIETFAHSSKVLLVIDGYFAVDAKSVETGKRCLVKGLQSDTLMLKPMPFLSHIEFQEGRAEFISGDELVTTGLGGIYPEGIPVGTVVFAEKTKTPFKRSLVLPAVDFTKIDKVYVLAKE